MIVADSGPLIALGRIGRLEVLPLLFGGVVVPPAVHAEVVRPPAAGASVLADASWFTSTPLPDASEISALLLSLDRGEAEAILLAEHLESAILIDERRGRDLARLRGLRVTGTGGVLLAAKRAAHISEVLPLLRDLEEAGVYIGEALKREALRRAGESDSDSGV